VTEWTGLALVQPGRSRRWEIRRGEETLASLGLPTFRRGGRAEIDGRSLTIEVHGLFRTEHVISDQTGEVLARVRPEGRRRVLELAGRELDWKSLGRRAGYGFVGRDGEPLLRAKVASGLFRTNGQLEIDQRLSRGDGALLALIAAYLLIRKTEEDAAVAASTVTAAGA
jgi:hypothetical protein